MRLPAELHPAPASVRIAWWRQLTAAERAAVDRVMRVFPGAVLAGHWRYQKRKKASRLRATWAVQGLPEPESEL